MAVICPETTLPFSANGSNYAFEMPSEIRMMQMDVGIPYIVEWDGELYTTIGKPITVDTIEMTYLGNLSVINPDNEDTGEPFIAVEQFVDPGYKYYIYTSEAADFHTIAINSVEEQPDTPEQPGEATGVSIVLYDRTGQPITYDKVETITTDTPTAGEVATFTHGVAVENADYELSMASGDQKVKLAKGELLKGFTIKKPEGLAPENVLEGVNIGGVVGSHKDDFVIEGLEIELDMSGGDQSLQTGEGYVVKSATIKKPETMLPENIKKDVDIGGVVGTMESGGGEPDFVTFFDYNGDVIARHPVSSIATLASLPTPPEHEGLTFQGWNYTLEEIKAEVAITEAMMNIAACYITSDGKTRLYVDINHSSHQKVTMYFSQTVANGVKVDWGDGTATTTRATTGTGSLTHTYSTLGEYVITLEVADGCTFGFGYNSSSNGLFGKTRGELPNILRKVEVGKNITTIGAYAFYYCYNLKSISIPVGVTSIGASAFYYPRNGFVFVGLPKGITSVGANAFYYCFSLKHISFPIGITSYGNQCFYSCYSLEELIIPTENAVTTQMFYSCYSLETLVNAVAYASDNFVKKVVFKNNESAIIPIKLCYYCKALSEVDISNENIAGIGSEAFYYCSGLQTFQIPETVTTIGDSAFGYCHSLEEVVLPDSVLSLGSSAFRGCYSLQRIHLPDGITSIGGYAFENCASLEEIVLPNGLTEIKAGTFNSCDNLRKIVIPSSVTNIAADFVRYPYSLREIHFLGTTPPTFAGALLNYGDISKCTFYVPKGSLDAYKSAANLSKYASQIVEEE